MLALRQEVRVLASLARLLQPAGATGGLGCTSGGGGASASAPAWVHAAVRHRWGAASGAPKDSNGGSGGGGGGGGITGWLTSKLPGILGGDSLEDMDLDSYASSLKRARQLGGLTGFAHGTSAAGDGQAQGTLRMFEQIIGAMAPEERKDLQLFDAAARQRVAAEVGVTTGQVDDCIARYLWTRQLTQKVAQLKKEGKEMPASVDEVERMLGTWREYKAEHENAQGGVPPSHQGPKGEPCGLAGQPVSRNTKCPVTRKAFKNCCGRTLRVGAS